MLKEQVGVVSSEPRLVRTEEDDGVTCLLLRNPPVNALSRGVLDELSASLTALAAEPRLRAVVLGGDGANFSAGADLKEMASIAPAEVPALLRRIQATFRALAELPVPTVAAVHGVAVGGGLELALACDLRVADDSAKFGAPEVSHGLMPTYGGTQRLPRLVGPAKAKEMIFTGALVPAVEALRIGLVNKVVGGGQDLRAARDLAHTIGQRAPRAVRAAKRAIALGADLDLAGALALEGQLFVEEVVPSSDLAEGIRAFGERRPPKFTGA
ncbi:MAG TPA: enoyl-CoA hydratase-related protein [Thermoplasmata archaeon]|nr:enoyl-CoA hydratase-related protein [Thermoplasmata archaeon]